MILQTYEMCLFGIIFELSCLSLHAVMLLEFHWGPGGGLQDVHQQKRRALLQKSSQRVKEIKAKGALAKTQREVRAPCETREKSEGKPAACQAKTKSGPQDLKRNVKTHIKSKGEKAEQAADKTTEKSVFIKQRKPQLPPPGI